jgi:glycosyltransferase involved in cell wall biosynthesis
MKIAIDIRSAGGMRAGKGAFTFNIVRELLKIDHKNHYLLYSDSGIAGFEEFKNAAFKIIDKKGIFWHIKAARDMKKEKVELFISPSSYIIPALSKIKSIIVVHDLVAFLFPQSHLKKAVFIEKLLLKRALKKASKIITVSENTKKDLIEKFKIDEQKIVTIPCAASGNHSQLDSRVLPESDCELKGSDSRDGSAVLPAKFFLSVGTIEPRKNYETLIQAFAMFHKTNPEHHLIIAGKKGWGAIDLDELITSNYLQKYVHILGYITNKSLNKLYNQAQAFIFPSYYEGFGIPPLEALKCGCPVISSYTSSMPEVLGEAAIFCDPSQPAEFAKAMEKIVSDANLRTELINKGRIQSNKFSWTSSAEKLKSNCYG